MSERQMRRLLALVAKYLGREWVDLSKWLRSLPENELAAIEARVVAGEVAIFGLDQAARRWAAETQGQYVRAAETVAKWLDRQKPLADRLVLFDVANDAAVRRARMNQLSHVRGFQEEAGRISQQITRRALIEGAGTGVNPRRIAQDFRDSIGLAPVQEDWVANFRRELEDGDFASARSRKLSDKRTLRSLGRDDRLTPAQIDKLVEAYRRRMIAYRATTIARTESGRNVHEGIRDSFRQALERGDISVEQLLKRWHARRPGPRAREQHQEMDGVEVGWLEDFELPDGTRMAHPHDDRGGAKHNASCGCTVSHSIAA